MQPWVDLVLFNAAGATLLAAMVAIVAPRVRRPALLHALWLVVLLKFVSFPAAEIALVPRLELLGDRLGSRPDSVEPLHAAPEPVRPLSHATATPELGMSGAREPTDGRPFQVVWLLGILALGGTCAWVSIVVARTWAFRRRVGAANVAPAAVQERVAELARRFGITRVPRVRWISGRLSPAVWLSRGRSEILFPADLWPRLSDPERDALLAHELAHLRRRDALLRYLELIVVALYWWHPVAWWSRRNLRAAEEQACDAMVLAALPGAARPYAEGLLKTVEFLARGGGRAHSLATANDVSTRLQERLIMILTVKPRSPLSSRVRIGMGLLALCALLVSPAWIEEPFAASDKPSPPVIRFARQQLALDKELHEIELRRMQVQYEFEQAQSARCAAEMRQKLQQLESADHQEEARAMRADLARLEREQAERRAEMESRQGYQAAQSELEFQLRELSIQMEEFQSTGREAEANAVLGRIQELEAKERALQLKQQQAEIERARKLLARETADLESLKTGQ